MEREVLLLLLEEEQFQQDVLVTALDTDESSEDAIAEPIVRMPCHTRPFTGDQLVNEMLNGHPKRGYHHFRVLNTMFLKLEELLVSRKLLRPSRFVSVREQLAIFLNAIGQEDGNRRLQETFQRSGETISRHFHSVLKAICALSEEFIQLPTQNVGVHPRVRGQRTVYPYFADAIGAIDGTHIPAHIKKSKQVPFRNRKGVISQNVMAAVSFDKIFLYVCTGWEGSAGDMKVLKWCLEDGDFVVPEGKFYLVDSGYSNTDKFLAPYRGGIYHLGTFNANTRAGRYRDAKDLFNHRHSQLRNCVEQAFGILKRRFKILKKAIEYPFETQRRIVLACCVIHNFIRRFQGEDKYFNKTLTPVPMSERADDWVPSLNAGNNERMRGEQLRDTIATKLWNDHRRRRRNNLEEA